MEQARRVGLRLGLFLWVPAVIAAYFVVHKPWAFVSEPALLGAAIDVLATSLMALLAGGVGRAIAGELEGLDPFEALAVQGATGFGALGLSVLAAGAVGVLSTAAAWLGLALGLLIFGRAGVDWALQWRGEGATGASLKRVGKPAAALSLALLGLALLQALAPPLKWDSLVYHLELPKQYLAMGRVGYVPHNLFVGFPQLAEMMYTWGLGLRAGTTAAAIGWWVGLLGMAGVAGMARRLLGPQAFWLAPAVVLSGASLWRGMSWAYVDHWVLLFGVAMFACLDRSRSDAGERSKWLILAGVLAGLALGTKYTGGLLLAGAGVLILGDAYIQHPTEGSDSDGPHRAHHGADRFGRVIRDLGLLAIVAFAVSVPWFLRNVLVTGNPIHPFLFPGRGVDGLRQMYQAQDVATRALIEDLLLPWAATVAGIEGGPRFNTSLGPLYLALIPGLFLGLSNYSQARRRSLTRFIWLGLLVWIVWAVGARVADPLSRSRHYFGFLGPLSVLACAGYLRLRLVNVYDVDLGWVIEKLVIFSFALTALAAVFHLGNANPIPAVTGHQGRYEYLGDQLGWFGPAMQAVNELPDGARVRFLWEPRGYYCETECIADVILDQWWYLNRTVGGPEEIAGRWRSEGVTHVLIYDLGVRLEKEAQPLLTEDDWAALDVFRLDYLDRERRFGDAYSLYELR